MSGWIKIHRSITNHWLYTENRKFSKFEAWNDMLLNVNYTESKSIIKGKLYEIKRGESIMSLDSWAKRWKWDKSSVRRFFSLLEKDEMIQVKTDNITTHLTICNYDTYQDTCNADETQMKHKRNTNEIQTTPIKESKEYKEEKEESTHALCLWIKNDLKNVSKLKQQLTNKEAERLLDKFDRFAVKEILEAMDNHKDLIKKNISVNSTIQNWIRRRQENNPNFGLKKQTETLSIEEQILKNYKA